MERIDLIRRQGIALSRAISRRKIFGKFDSEQADNILHGLITVEDAKLELNRQTAKTPIQELKTSYQSMINRIA